MEILEKIFFEVLQTSLTASIVAILVIVLLKAFHNHIGVRVKHILWLLVLIKLFIPFIPETQINLFSILYEKYESTLLVQDEKNNLQDGKELSTVRKERNDEKIYNQDIKANEKDNIQEINKQNLVLWTLKIASCIWAIGVLILIGTFLLFIFNFKRKVKYLKNDSYPEIVDLIKVCRHKANIRSRIPIFVYDGFKSPCILGFIKPKIYIPEHVLRTSDNKQLSYIFLHELIHYKRKDLVYNFLGIIALSIHWFNPIVWFAINKMKIYREYACDACVLEILGEKETIEYGMTLINFSRVFSNKNEDSRVAIFFEANNQIKGRIEMIKEFKKGSYKISRMAAIGCLIAATVVITNGVTVKALEANNAIIAMSSNTVNTNDAHKFLVDAPLKSYRDIEKTEKVAGFKFKLPDFLPQSNKADPSFQIIKLSDKDNVLLAYLEDDVNFSFQVSEKDPLEYLKKIETQKNRILDNLKVESEEQSMKLGEIDGLSVTITANVPAKIMENGYSRKESQEVTKYFAWKNEGLWYSIKYNSIVKSAGENSKQRLDISQDNIEKIATSIKYPEEIKNVDYSVEEEVSTEIATMMIYDKEDLEKAKNILGFNPKFPLKINEDINISDSSVGITGDSDIKNNNINYLITSLYSYKDSVINFTQEKTSKDYDEIKKNGYFTQENAKDNKTKQINAEKLNINNNEVFKYEEKEQEQEQGSDVVYVWKENDIYCSVTFFIETENSDEIVKEFVNSKPID